MTIVVCKWNERLDGESKPKSLWKMMLEETKRRGPDRSKICDVLASVLFEHVDAVAHSFRS